jgi:hypothetical protein
LGKLTAVGSRRESQDLEDTTAGGAYGAKPSVTNRQPEFVFRLDGGTLPTSNSCEQLAGFA